jgi:hypothetical protein
MDLGDRVCFFAAKAITTCWAYVDVSKKFVIFYRLPITFIYFVVQEDEEHFPQENFEFFFLALVFEDLAGVYFVLYYFLETACGGREKRNGLVPKPKTGKKRILLSFLLRSPPALALSSSPTLD